MNDFSKKLSELVGTGEAWITFMDTVKSELSDVLKQGKPRRESIENSVIGELGFKSWIDFIEAPRNENGLAWNQASWKLYKRAYSVVEKHPYLRQTELSASFISTLNRELSEFPATLESLEYEIKTRASKLEAKKGVSLLASRQEINDLKDQVADLNIKLAEQRGKIESSENASVALREDFSALTAKHSELSAKYTQVSSELQNARKKVKHQTELLKRYRNMGIADKFKFLFGL
jgi:hypothetical protein